MDNKLMIALGLNSKEFKAGMQEASRLTSQLQSQFTSLAAAIGIGFGVSKVIGFAKESLEYVTNIRKETESINFLLSINGRLNDATLNSLKLQREEYEKIGMAVDKTAAIQKLVIEKYPKSNTAAVTSLTGNIIDYSVLNNVTGEAAANLIDRAITNYAVKGSARGLPGVSENDQAALAKYAQAHKGDKNWAEEATEYFNKILSKYHNAAEIRAAADPMTQFNANMLKLKETTGNLATTLVNNFSPALINVIKGLNKFVEDVSNPASDIGSTFRRFAEDIRPTFEQIKSVFTGLITENGPEILKSALGIIGDVAKVGGQFIQLTKPEITLFANTLKNNIQQLGLFADAIQFIISKIPSVWLNDKKEKLYTALGEGVEYGKSLLKPVVNDFYNMLPEAVKYRDDGLLGPNGQSEFNKSVGTPSAIINKKPNITPFDEEINNAGSYLKEITKNTKKTEEHTKKFGTESPKFGAENGVAGSTVKGVQPKQIIINIHDGLINHLTNTFTSVKESAAEIERIVEQAIINGIHAGETLSMGG